MHKHFAFLGVQAQQVKVSQGPFIGLPSVTGLTGLARAFSIALARSEDVEASGFQPDGICLAIENYELHHGFVKAHKGATAKPEATADIWASFTAHLVFRLRAESSRARDILLSQDLQQRATDVLGELSLCKGKLIVMRKPVNLASERLARRYPDELERAMAMLPSRALVLRDESHLVTLARERQMPLMDVLVAATLRHSQRPEPHRGFFEDMGYTQRRLYPVLGGFYGIEATASSQSTRLVQGKLLPSRAVSPMFTLASLQTAASVRACVASNLEEPYAALWKEGRVDDNYVCLATA